MVCGLPLLVHYQGMLKHRQGQKNGYHWLVSKGHDSKPLGQSAAPVPRKQWGAGPKSPPSPLSPQADDRRAAADHAAVLLHRYFAATCHPHNKSCPSCNTQTIRRQTRFASVTPSSKKCNASRSSGACRRLRKISTPKLMCLQALAHSPKFLHSAAEF